MRRHVRCIHLVVVLLLVLAVLPAVPGAPFAPQLARAGITTFTSSGGISMGDGAASPFPATINVSGLASSVLHLSVTLTNLRFYNRNFFEPTCHWDDFDVLLAGPGGQSSILMSDVYRDGNLTFGDVQQRTLTFDDNAGVYLPSDGSFSDGTYWPTDYAPSDTFPAPAPPGPYDWRLAAFTGAPANGVWSLYVLSERADGYCIGALDSWSLTITDGALITNSGAITISDNTPASPYSSTVAVSGMQGHIMAMSVTIHGLTHDYPPDLDILLVNPAGIGVILMSDAGKYDLDEVTLTFDDTATQTVGWSPPSGTYRPTNIESGVPDTFPGPAPAGPYGTTLSAFPTGKVNGIWSLYVVDDYNTGVGMISGGWSLRIVTDPFAPVTTATSEPERNAAGWHQTDATVTLNATDTGGSGFQHLTYRASGVVSIDPTTTLSSTVPVSIATEGITTLRFFATDTAGNVEATRQRTIRIDKTLPSVTAPLHSLAPTIPASNVQVTLNWSGSDATSGLARYELHQSTNGGAYTAVTLPTALTTSLTRTLAPGTYRFQVRSIDRAGNASASVLGSRFRVVAAEENVTCSASVTTNCLTYTGSWSQVSVAGAHGGKVRLSGTTGNRATIRFTGNKVSWTAVKGPDRGIAEVWVDGVKRATVDLYHTTTSRSVVFRRNDLTNGAHTLEIRVLGTKRAASSGTKVVIDVFSVLRPM